MFKKFVIFTLFVLMLGSISAQGELSVTVSSFSYSDDLKAGDIFIWDVSSNFTAALQEDFFEDGSVIKLEILKDLAGVSFTGDLASTQLSEYFALQFGTFSFVDDQDSIHTVVFPNEVTLDNSTTLNPLQGLWVDVIVDRFEFDDATVSVAYTEVGDTLTIAAGVQYKEGVFDATADMSATIDTNLGIVEELHLVIDLPALPPQSLDFVQRDISGVESTDDTTEDAPINFLWFALPIFALPLVKKFRK